MFFRRKKREKPKEEKTEKTEKSTLIILDTNIPMDCAKFQKMEFLDRLEAKADVFVPWAVCKELITFTRMAEEDKKVMEDEDFEKYMEWKDKLKKDLTRDRPGANLTPERAESIIESRLSQADYSEDACSFVQEKINTGKWKTIGTQNELKKYLNFEETVKKLVNERRADLEILASCFLAAEKYEEKKIVLMSRDRMLRSAAEKFGIRTHRGSRDRSSLFKK